MPTKVQVRVKANAAGPDGPLARRGEEKAPEGESTRVIDLRTPSTALGTSPSTALGTSPSVALGTSPSAPSINSGQADPEPPVTAPLSEEPRAYEPSYNESRDRRDYGSRNGYPDEGSSMGRDVPTTEVGGILDITGDGHGFLRPKFRPSDRDVYI
ncbi:hypothetical protein HYW40_00310, partial [Candidatus Curtissbacteria bacterium]|nr:hypothetical protein [Candidatus Curtissbacteria bacterium]